MRTNFSIWTVEGRLEIHKRIIDTRRLESLKRKRIRQLTRLIEKLQKINLKKVRRYETRLAYLT